MVVANCSCCQANGRMERYCGRVVIKTTIRARATGLRSRSRMVNPSRRSESQSCSPPRMELPSTWAASDFLPAAVVFNRSESHTLWRVSCQTEHVPQTCHLSRRAKPAASGPALLVSISALMLFSMSATRVSAHDGDSRRRRGLNHHAE